MSIQRKSVLVESDGGYGGMVNDRLGAYVTYADHLAEVERLRQEWTQQDFILDKGDPFRQAYRAGYDKGIHDAHESASWCQDPDEMLQTIIGLLDMPPPPPLPPSVGVPQKWL